MEGPCAHAQERARLFRQEDDARGAFRGGALDPELFAFFCGHVRRVRRAVSAQVRRLPGRVLLRQGVPEARLEVAAPRRLPQDQEGDS